MEISWVCESSMFYSVITGHDILFFPKLFSDISINAILAFEVTNIQTIFPYRVFHQVTWDLFKAEVVRIRCP